MSATTTVCRACRDHPVHDVTVCQPCMDELHGHLHAIPDIVRDLNIETTKQARRSLGPATITVGHETPLPFNLAAAAAHDRLRSALKAACMSVANTQHRRPPADTIGAMCAWLIRHERSIPLLEAGGDICNSIDRAIRRARRVIDNPPERRYIGECECVDTKGEPTRLYARMGEAVYACPNPECGAEWVVAERFAQLEQELSDYGLTRHELETLLPGVPRTTLASWISRESLPPQGTTAEGEPVYRYGDVLALDARRRQRGRKAS